jgi:holliday junction resolvase Hjr
MSTPYEQGRRFAYRVSQALVADGYSIIRSAGSKTKVDIVAFKPWATGAQRLQHYSKTQLLFVQAKKSTNGTIPSSERIELLRLAGLAHALPIVAYSTKPRGPIAYRRLAGPGPKDWQPWTPDEAAP